MESKRGLYTVSTCFSVNPQQVAGKYAKEWQVGKTGSELLMRAAGFCPTSESDGQRGSVHQGAPYHWPQLISSQSYLYLSVAWDHPGPRFPPRFTACNLLPVPPPSWPANPLKPSARVTPTRPLLVSFQDSLI